MSVVIFEGNTGYETRNIFGRDWYRNHPDETFRPIKDVKPVSVEKISVQPKSLSRPLASKRLAMPNKVELGE
jgi:hypothetical protein